MSKECVIKNLNIGHMSQVSGSGFLVVVFFILGPRFWVLNLRSWVLGLEEVITKCVKKLLQSVTDLA